MEDAAVIKAYVEKATGTVDRELAQETAEAAIAAIREVYNEPIEQLLGAYFDGDDFVTAFVSDGVSYSTRTNETTQLFEGLGDYLETPALAEIAQRQTDATTT